MIFKKKKQLPETYTEAEMEAMEAHIAARFGEFANVFHEIVSPDIHVDICIIEPTPERNYFTLVTMGMGAHRAHAAKKLFMKRLIAVLVSLAMLAALSSCEKTSLENLSAREKRRGITLIWKTAKEKFVFWDRLGDLDWDGAYREALEAAAETKDTREYYLEVMKFLSLPRDGHSGIYDYPEGFFEPYGALPFYCRHFDGKHVIVNADASLESEIYCELLKINGLPTQQYIEERIFPYIWHEKLDSIYPQIWQLIPLIEAGEAIEIETENGIFSVKPAPADEIHLLEKHALTNDEDLTRLYASDTLTVDVTDDNIAVITIPTFDDDTLPEQFYEILPEIKDCKGFLIDVRWNGGGNSGNADAVAQAFIDGSFETFRSRMRTTKRPNRAGEYTLDDNIYRTHIEECPVYTDAPLVVLANAFTGSAAEDFLVALDNICRATIVGTASNGSTGQPILKELPGDGTFRICTRWCLYPDGRDFINTGVQPQVWAALALEDYQNDFDSVISTGMEVLRGQMAGRGLRGRGLG